MRESEPECCCALPHFPTEITVQLSGACSKQYPVVLCENLSGKKVKESKEKKFYQCPNHIWGELRFSGNLFVRFLEPRSRRRSAEMDFTSSIKPLPTLELNTTLASKFIWKWQMKKISTLPLEGEGFNIFLNMEIYTVRTCLDWQVSANSPSTDMT